MARKGFGQQNKKRPSGVPDPVRKKLPRYKKRFKTRPSAVVQALALNIVRLRKARDWSQEALAGECGLEQQVISLLENGRANPTLMLVESLALAFGVPFVELFEARPRLRRSNSPAK
jgi:ribosome-binding protein aMBF1 (putative translation factor)